MHAAKLSLSESLISGPKIAYTIEEACVVGSMSRASLYRCFAKGELVAIREGRSCTVLRKDLEALLEKRKESRSEVVTI